MLHNLTSDIFGLHFIFRWLHVFFGVMWIGLLYYFNYVQGAFMAETDAAAKSQVLQKLLPRAMWWFRWGAMWTFVTGLIMLMIRAHLDTSGGGMAVFGNPYWTNILTGAFFGTLMFLNVWLIIWPKQKIVIANATAVAGGAAANPLAAPSGASALLASRTNTLFSVPMLFFMLATNHMAPPITENSNLMAYWLVTAAVILGLEANAIFGKTGPITTIKGVVTSGFVLTGVLVVVMTIFI